MVGVVNRNEIVKYGVAECFDGDIDKVCSDTGFTKQQVTWWLEDRNQPQASNVSRLMYRAFAPKFRVIAEYVPRPLGPRRAFISRLLPPSKGTRRPAVSMPSMIQW
jgi:hypothetical protein